MELEEFEATELSAFEADVKAEGDCLLETAQLLTGALDAAVAVVAEAISWALEHLLEAQPSEYRSRLRRQVIKTAISFVRRRDAGEVPSPAHHAAQLSLAAWVKSANCAFGPNSSIEATDSAHDLLQNLSYLPRIAFVLRHMLGYSIPESALLLGVDVPTFAASLRGAYLELGAGVCLEKKPQLTLVLTQRHWTSPSLV